VQTLTLTTREVIPATPRTRILIVDLGAHQFAYHAGQAVFAGLAGGPVMRPYSIACSPGQARRMQAIELLVQIDDHRAPDPHLERAVTGTTLRIEGPFGSFGLPADDPHLDLLLIAGGTGISPLRSILWDTLERRADTRIAVVYSARTAAEIAYRDELIALAGARRIQLFLTITRDDGGWTGQRGRIDAALVAAALRTTETQCVICGPAGLVSDCRQLLQAAGVAGNRMLVETYLG
jgi:ferredoxin-NADP reductase